MEQRISLITLGVSDLGRATKFYQALGWQPATNESEPGIVCFDLHSMALALYPLEKLAEDANIEPPRQVHSSIVIAHNVNSEADVDGVLASAAEAGATITKLAQKAFWGGYSGCFCDPDGHIWEIAHNPFSKLGPKGEFQWHGINDESK